MPKRYKSDFSFDDMPRWVWYIGGALLAFLWIGLGVDALLELLSDDWTVGRSHWDQPITPITTLTVILMPVVVVAYLSARRLYEKFTRRVPGSDIKKDNAKKR